MKLKTFKPGGVHPPANKLSANAQTVKLDLPNEVSIPLSQHQGAPAVPVVKKVTWLKWAPSSPAVKRLSPPTSIRPCPVRC